MCSHRVLRLNGCSSALFLLRQVGKRSRWRRSNCKGEGQRARQPCFHGWIRQELLPWRGCASASKRASAPRVPGRRAARVRGSHWTCNFFERVAGGRFAARRRTAQYEQGRRTAEPSRCRLAAAAVGCASPVAAALRHAAGQRIGAGVSSIAVAMTAACRLPGWGAATRSVQKHARKRPAPHAHGGCRLAWRRRQR